jgi:hypothetical protein
MEFTIARRVSRLYQDLLDLYSEWIELVGQVFDNVQNRVNDSLKIREKSASERFAGASMDRYDSLIVLHNIPDPYTASVIKDSINVSGNQDESIVEPKISADGAENHNIESLFSGMKTLLIKYSTYLNRCVSLTVGSVDPLYGQIVYRLDQLYHNMVQDTGFFIDSSLISNVDTLTRRKATVLLESMLNFPHKLANQTLCEELDQLLQLLLSSDLNSR